MSSPTAVEKLGIEFARANEFLRAVDALPELSSTPSVARVRMALAHAGALLARLYEHRGEAPAEELERVDEADRAIRLAEKAIDRARDLLCFARKAREERKRGLQDVRLHLVRARLDRLRMVP